MAIQVKQLKMKTLTSNQDDVYYAPKSKAAVVKSIRLVNEGTGIATVNLWVRRGSGAAYRIIPKDLTLPVGNSCIDDSELTLEGFDPEANSDRIQGQATGTGASVSIVLSGIERDA